MYSNSLDDAAEELEGGRECIARIGGWRVKVVSGYDARGTWRFEGAKHVVAAAWRNADGSVLTLFATGADSADVPALLSIVRSVRIEGLKQR